MPSIQQAMNQGIGALAGLGVAGAYMLERSDFQKARNATYAANKMGKTYINEDTPEARAHNSKLGNTVEGLREQAASLHPSDKNLEAYGNAIDKNKELQEKLTEQALREAEQQQIDAENERDEQSGVSHSDEGPAGGMSQSVRQHEAEQNALDSLNRSITQQTNTAEGISTRRALIQAMQDKNLSAKHRGQLFEMERRLAKGGEPK